jgi:hypothetical protein
MCQEAQISRALDPDKNSYDPTVNTLCVGPYLNSVALIEAMTFKAGFDVLIRNRD